MSSPRIEQGRTFSSFQPLQTHKPPVSQLSQPWSRRRIDPFVLAAMRQQGLSPSPAADRRTLIRRLSFDLTGLPPTPTEIDRFLNDQTPDAVKDLVERLLASPAYGEHWARMWLDLARYTDATASWLNGTAQAHLYRDWVVRALNQDMHLRSTLETMCHEAKLTINQWWTDDQQ